MTRYFSVVGIALFLLILAVAITWGWFRFFTTVEQHVRGNTPQYAEYADSMVGKMFESSSKFAQSDKGSRDFLGAFGSMSSARKQNESSFKIREILGLNRVYEAGVVQMSPSFALIDQITQEKVQTSAQVKVSIEDQKHLKIYSQSEASYDSLNGIWETSMLQTLPEGRFRLVVQVSCIVNDSQCIKRYGEDLAMEFVEFSVR